MEAAQRLNRVLSTKRQYHKNTMQVGFYYYTYVRMDWANSQLCKLTFTDEIIYKLRLFEIPQKTLLKSSVLSEFSKSYLIITLWSKTLRSKRRETVGQRSPYHEIIVGRCPILLLDKHDNLLLTSLSFSFSHDDNIPFAGRVWRQINHQSD